MKEQEKYKKRFTNSLKAHKNIWNYTNNRFESKPKVSKHRLKQRGDILKKHYISNKELDFLFDQVTSRSGYDMLKDDIFINHSFNSEYFLVLRKKKEATFEREDVKVAEQSTSAGKNIMVDDITTNSQELAIREQDNVLPWQEILNKFVPITKPEFHRGLNSVRDLDTLKTFHDGVRKKRRDHLVSYSYVRVQCDIKARKIKDGWY
ncbi:hypothetical protein RhiirA5_387617 [Rhizophagus irregularis]|uniref:Uncharacterized protein n=1 Tax=Rhizophagus irregularis TaxID=588596 RepID=A0A2N0NDT6_9GLOM|nr:hypothetical protein RhiirA5_387617 [Rhizophagus irregularis]